MEEEFDRPIVLPNEIQVPAVPGKYRIEPPPDLNEVARVERRFFLDYDSPYLIVREIALPPGSGNISFSRGGYQFNKPTPSCEGKQYHQLIPSLAYVDERTWSGLSQEVKDAYYVPRVPTVVIALVSETENLEDSQAKVTSFVDAGTREGVVVDTRRDRIRIYNHNLQPYFDALAPIEFDSWPRFTLNCLAIRDFRTRYGLP